MIESYYFELEISGSSLLGVSFPFLSPFGIDLFLLTHHSFNLVPSLERAYITTDAPSTLLPLFSSTHGEMSVQPGAHCGDTRPIDRVGLRVSALFVILITSLIGTLFPIITKRVKYLRKRVPGVVFEFGK